METVLPIADTIKAFFKRSLREEQIYSSVGIAVNVTDTEFDFIGDDTKLTGVLTQTLSVGSNAIRIVPKENTSVLIVYTSNTTAHIVNAAEPQYISVSAPEIKISADITTFNGGERHGLVLAANLVNKLNTIEGKINSIVATYNSHTHPANNTPATTAISGTLPNTSIGDLESQTIKQ